MHKYSLILFLIPLSIFAQRNPPGSLAQPQLEAMPPERKYTREQMEEMLAQQEVVVEALSEQFFDLNEEIENRIQQIVEAIAKLEDSDASGTRISRMKRRIIEDLKTSIFQLQQKRNANAAAISRLPAYRQETTAQGRAVEFLDEKVKSRLDQIMLMASSLHQHKDVRKYTYKFSNDYYGRNDVRVRRRRSDEWKQNRQQTINAEMERKSLIEAIEKAEHRINNEIGHLRAEGQRAGLTQLPPDQEARIKQQQELLDILKEKKKEILSGKQTPTQSVGSRQRAMEIERQLTQAVESLRVTNNRLRQLGIRLGHELTRLDAQQQVLARHDARMQPQDGQEIQETTEDPAPEPLPAPSTERL